MPPITASVANTVNGAVGPYTLMMPMKGTHKNQPRAQTADENMSVLRFSAVTSSAVHVVRMDMDVDVATLMAIEGIISRATMW